MVTGGDILIRSLWDAIQAPSVTDWIQALGSITAVIVAYLAFRISKSALQISRQMKNVTEAGFRCVIYPVKFTFRNGKWLITFRNNGAGLAFNVVVKVFVRNGQIPYGDPAQMIAEGSQVINPNTEQFYSIDEAGTSLLIFDETPINITWETLTGARYEAKWVYSQTPNGDERFMLKVETRSDKPVAEDGMKSSTT